MSYNDVLQLFKLQISLLLVSGWLSGDKHVIYLQVHCILHSCSIPQICETFAIEVLLLKTTSFDLKSENKPEYLCQSMGAVSMLYTV